MKQYKVVQTTSKDIFEEQLNELAQAGWKVISANIAYLGDAKYTTTYFALLESMLVETELKQMMETRSDDIVDNVDLSPSAN